MLCGLRVWCSRRHGNDQKQSKTVGKLPYLGFDQLARIDLTRCRWNTLLVAS